MTEDAAREYLTCFRRQMWIVRLLRGGFLGCALGVLVAYYCVEPALQRWLILGLGALVGVWIVLGVRGAGLAKRARLGAALLDAGEIDEARKHLTEALRRFTSVRSVKILTCHQLAVAAHLAHSYRSAVAICQELLSYRLGPMSSIAAGVRLILADSLLMLDDVSAAANVIARIRPADLSLLDRMTLLPIGLRYDLAADRDADAVQGLVQKVRLAELLDGPGACLAHALLAEACRRNDMDAQHDYLLKRAELLGNVDDVVKKHPSLLERLRGDPPAAGPPEPADS